MGPITQHQLVEQHVNQSTVQAPLFFFEAGAGGAVATGAAAGSAAGAATRYLLAAEGGAGGLPPMAGVGAFLVGVGDAATLASRGSENPATSLPHGVGGRAAGSPTSAASVWARTASAAWMLTCGGCDTTSP